jgi:phage host-nuclease inhibitor protein Gam
MARMKKQKGPVLKTREDVEQCVGVLARLTIDRMGVEATLNDELKAVRDRYQEELTNLGEDADAEFRMLKEWAEAHPEEFSEKKSLELTHGVIGFRTGTPAVRFMRGVSEDEAIALIKLDPRWDRYLRMVTEINKQAIIEDREALEAAGLAALGLKITQSETFYAEPTIEPKG